jgi:alpha-L-rhamnosidase
MTLVCLVGTAAAADRSHVSVLEFGALADGKTMDTRAIQSAINACAQAGGGTVSLPAGTYLSGSLELKSNIVLRLEPGSVLRGSSDLKDYPANGFKHN